MFAPRSTHIPRTYSVYQQPTTTKKNTNKENANALPSRTPSRSGKMAMGGPSTGMRMGLGIKTEGRDRNILMQQQNGGGKGKGKEGEDIEPKRLFANGPSKSISIPPSKSLSSMPHIQLNQTTHKTPARSSKKQNFQALRTPAPVMNEPAPTPLPSATRARRRSRASLSNISLTPIKSSIEQNFQTPAPKQWEEELSLGNIEETTNEILQNVQEENEIEEDYEPEYMPPPVQEIPFTPAYDHPDLVAIFSTLSGLPPMWSKSDDVIIREVPAFEVEAVDIQGMILKDDADLEEDWLRPKSKPLVPIQKPRPAVNNSRVTTTKGASIQSRQQASVVVRPDIQTSRMTNVRTPSTLSRSTIVPSTRPKTITPVSRTLPVRQNIINRPTIPGRSSSQVVARSKPIIKIADEDKELFDSWDQLDSVPEFQFDLDFDDTTLTQ
ncbi:uncharacterized protein I206_102809 [Kwoniella pini CBS 10737]|uniref:Uncharacterized protein n=1 Tax=Kwoniella pini CBS 10737 TaxID=1296096 RepID=A0A1B9I6F2_9TREE|nr:uncharacterized protein I206_03163 [Kwoniella pini CBS 10737]OCF51097.1 hypothetical protein I206_03163 [Kwoniella pini CBS 10737]